jgi:hypothetical protein
MKMDNNLQSFYRSNISSKLNKKTKSLQFLPQVLQSISVHKTINFNDKKIKVSYIIDIVHNLMLKYYFKKENSFVINATVLKQKYGHEYKSYVDYLTSNGIISMKCNYKAGVISRIYQLNPQIFKSKILRVKNDDKVLIKKYKKKVFDSIDFVDAKKSSINQEIREKLISDLFSVDIDFERSIFFLNCLKREDIDIYNRNIYSVESINDKHIFYHFDDYGRLHTNFTILKSFIRKNCLLIDGEETCEIDIKNSQPLFLCKLINDSKTAWVNKEEFEFFKSLTISGNFYQYMMQVSGIKDRNQVKELTYKVLFGMNRSNSKSDLLFSKLFPTIHHFIKLYKKEYGNYKILAHDLQRAESGLIYNKIIKKLMLLHPDIKLLTVHDSIVFPKRYRDEVQCIFDWELSQEFDLK